MGVGTILEARKIILLANGEKKAAAIAAAIEGPVTSMITASAAATAPRLHVHPGPRGGQPTEDARLLRVDSGQDAQRPVRSDVNRQDSRSRMPAGTGTALTVASYGRLATLRQGHCRNGPA